MELHQQNFLPIKRMFLLGAACIIAALSGCAPIPTKPIKAQATIGLKDQNLTLVKRKIPDFPALTPTKAVLGLLAVPAQISEGNALISAGRIDDPANLVAENIAKTLAAGHGMKINPNPLLTESRDVAEISAAIHANGGYALDVRTGWSMGYFPSNWTHYRVMYVGRAHLIEVATATVISEAECRRIPETDTNAPTYDEISAHNSVVLKRILLSYSNDCTKELMQKMFPNFSAQTIHVQHADALEKPNAANNGQPIAKTSIQSENNSVTKPILQTTTPATDPPSAVAYPDLTVYSVLNLPVHSERMQASLERYLKRRPPKYFFVDDAGHFGWANGTRPASQPNEPDDPKERALRHCMDKQERKCVLFAVDQKLVYGTR